MADIPLILFAKIPIAGQVKTRLHPELSLEQAAQVAKILLVETLKLTTEHWPGQVVLALWPNAENDFVQQQLAEFNVSHITQVQGDLGKKMQSAMDDFVYPSAVMGCDVPHLSSTELIKAYQFLSEGNNVIGPTNDGGYYLLGLQESSPKLFTDHSWGESSVLHTSEKVAAEQKIELSHLNLIDDIDTYQDLVQASKKIKRLRKFVK